MKNMLFCAALICATLATVAVQAQDVDNEMAVFVQQFQEAYNRKDHTTLQTLYTDYAVRLAKDGTKIPDTASVGGPFVPAPFNDADVTLVLTLTRISWSNASHTYIIKGTYRAKGVNARGRKIKFSGAYTHTMIKENGRWKIAKSVLGA
jgi:ketosteroid isomerase-like protein